MVTTTVWADAARPSSHLRYGVSTVDNGETASLAIPNGGRGVVRIGIPTITTGTLTFTVTPYQGATARVLKDTSGNTVAVASSTGDFVTEIPELSGCYEFTIVCGAAQGAARSFQVQMVGLDPVPSSINEVTIESFSGTLPVTGTVTSNQGSANAAPWLFANPAEWSVTHGPVSNTVATITKAPGTGTQKHVATGLSFVVTSAATAPTATTLTINLRDGGTGAGTILKTWTVGVMATAGASQGVARNGMYVTGTAATAMTLEFTAAGGANTIESVELDGYTTA